jgi:PIN domain nuclease of toxin-antitoxin system
VKRLLLDTKVVVWLLLGDRAAVSATATRALDDPANTLCVSAVSVWEIAVKRSLGKLEIEDGWASALAGLDLQPVPVTAVHAAHVETLPWHHRDPFDRLLVSQAAVDAYTLVTSDPRLGAYGVPVIW